jgi:predicted double-glycine peptidase
LIKWQKNNLDNFSEPKIFKNNIEYLSYSKKQDLLEIEIQKETISQLKDILKDLSYVVEKNNLMSQLNESTKNQLEKLNLIQVKNFESNEKKQFSVNVNENHHNKNLGQLKMMED